MGQWDVFRVELFENTKICVHSSSSRPNMACRWLIRERDILGKFINVLPVKTDRLMNCFETTAAFISEA